MQHHHVVAGLHAVAPVPDALVHGGDHVGDPGQDAGEQDDGDAVAHAELVDLLAHPHHEGGTGDEGNDDDQSGPDAVGAVHQQVVVAHHHIVAEGLENRDRHGGIPGDGLDLPLALLAAVAGQTLQIGDGHGQQLDDDGAVDIGLDAQGEDLCLGKGAAAHHIEQTQNGTAHEGHLAAQGLDIDIGNGDGITDPENQQDQNGEDDLFPQLGDAPCLANGLDHVTSPLPFRLLPR